MSRNKKFGHIKTPLKRIHIELTNVCEFNCAFCPKSEMKRPYLYMDADLAKGILDQIRQAGLAEKVTFHVMGEPTLHPRFLEILDHAEEIGLPVGLTTNGAGLGRAVGRELLDRKLHQIDVSFQTPDRESYQLRGAKGLDFDDYFEGMVNFFVEYHTRHPETIFKFRFLNTTFRSKSMEKKTGPIKVMSSSRELRQTFGHWVERIYDLLGKPAADLDLARKRLNKLKSFKWNVVEILPNVFFETYILSDWGHSFKDRPVKPAWAGYCFGMRDHFAILANGDLTLCCIDFNGRTAMGNLKEESLAEILSSDRMGRVMDGFNRFQLVHPYCKHCLGSTGTISWLFKPMVSVIGLYALKPYFYHHSKLY